MSDAGETEPDIWTRRARPAFLYVIYALFGTGYLGYTAARAWGKAKGSER